ncbi:phage/plasmid primase, P4 family [Oscillospiraceae bacterium OttesenSCG-928-G22]|nr:phage/plasmid primase, P4 family [Oscillospiraceae bacterium OttesenSCG-928-G22]
MPNNHPGQTRTIPPSPNGIIRDVTEKYLKTLTPNTGTFSLLSTVEHDLINRTQDEISAQNKLRDKTRQIRQSQTLSASQIASIINYLYPCRNIPGAGGESSDTSYDLLAIYQTEGYGMGTYTISETYFHKLVRILNREADSKFRNEAIEHLRLIAPRKARCRDRDLIAVNNGIFNYKTKQLMPFTHEKVFLSKSRVNYNYHARNVIIQNADDGSLWDIESWLLDLMNNDPELANLVWEILGAIIRPNVRWDKSAWFYSETGSNGKGTLCELMRQLCGEGTYACIPVSDFAKEFLLEPLLYASAIIVDENDVGTYIDKAANLKAVITNDTLQINRKFKIPIAYQFYGFMVQCLNEFPKLKDKSDSIYRRQLFIPMTRCFTGKERKYIKNDYLHREDVLEYVMYKVLNTNYYSLSEPKACRAVLDEYKEHNDPVRRFFDEIGPRLQWDLVPFSFLYDLYKSWHKQNNPSGSPQGSHTFTHELRNIIKSSNEWYCKDRKHRERHNGRMSKAEPLIAEYDLLKWYTPGYKGADPYKHCNPKLGEKYEGIYRRANSQSANAQTASPQSDDD